MTGARAVASLRETVAGLHRELTREVGRDT